MGEEERRVKVPPRQAKANDTDPDCVHASREERIAKRQTAKRVETRVISMRTRAGPTLTHRPQLRPQAAGGTATAGALLAAAASWPRISAAY
jgi:hypothetical protein